MLHAVRQAIWLYRVVVGAGKPMSFPKLDLFEAVSVWCREWLHGTTASDAADAAADTTYLAGAERTPA